MISYPLATRPIMMRCGRLGVDLIAIGDFALAYAAYALHYDGIAMYMLGMAIARLTYTTQWFSSGEVK